MIKGARSYLTIFLWIKSAAEVAAKQYNWKKRKFLVRHSLVRSQNIDILAISPFLRLRGENKDNLRWWKENIPARMLTASNQIKLGLAPELPNHKMLYPDAQKRHPVLRVFVILSIKTGSWILCLDRKWVTISLQPFGSHGRAEIGRIHHFCACWWCVYQGGRC